MYFLRSAFVVVVACGSAAGADWPQWLGPKRDGSSTETVKPWKGELKALWRKTVGPGHSSPVIAGAKVYLFTRGDNSKGQQQETLAVFDAKTGKPLWAKSYARGSFWSPFGTGPQGTPAVAGGKVYTFGATGILSCFDADKGSLVWQVDTWKKFDVTTANKRRLFFGAACSPLVEGEKVIVNVGGAGASVVAFNKNSGEVVWKSLDDKASYSSGIAFGQGKERQLVFLTAAGVRSLNPADGTPLWMFPLVDKLNESSTTPVRVGDLLLAGSVTFGMVGLDLETTGAKQNWKNQKLTCYFSTPIPVGKEQVYIVTGKATLKNPSSTLHCVETRSGQVLWSKVKIGRYHAAMLRTADDKLLLLSDLGDLVLVDPDPKGFKELARSKVSKDREVWAHPALADGRVYFRDGKDLICLQLSE
jgi:outer membrane protein assembly factor BamB